MLTTEFPAFVTGVIVSRHVMACTVFFEHLMFLGVFILFVLFSQNAWRVFCMLLDVFVVLCFLFLNVFERFCPNLSSQEGSDG